MQRLRVGMLCRPITRMHKKNDQGLLHSGIGFFI